MTELTNKLHALIGAYRASEAPTDAVALADYLVAQTGRPHLVEDCSDGMVYAWETAEAAAEYAGVCILAQHPAEGQRAPGVNHKTRKLMFVDEQTRWQGKL